MKRGEPDWPLGKLSFYTWLKRVTFSPKWTIRLCLIPLQPLGSGWKWLECLMESCSVDAKTLSKASQEQIRRNVFSTQTSLMNSIEIQGLLLSSPVSPMFVFSAPLNATFASARRALPGGVCGRRPQWRGLHGGDDKKPGPRPHRGHDKQQEAQCLGLRPSVRPPWKCSPSAASLPSRKKKVIYKSEI